MSKDYTQTMVEAGLQLVLNFVRDRKQAVSLRTLYYAIDLMENKELDFYFALKNAIKQQVKLQKDTLGEIEKRITQFPE